VTNIQLVPPAANEPHFNQFAPRAGRPRESKTQTVRVFVMRVNPETGRREKFLLFIAVSFRKKYY
jgi:hypothetical protein